MKLGFQHLVCVGLPFLLAACGSDTPSFVEKPEGIVYLSVDGSASDEDSFDMDELMSEDGQSADAVAYSGDFSETGEALDAAETGEAMDAEDTAMKNSKNRGKSKNQAMADNDDDAQSADALPVTSTPDSGTSGSSSSGTTTASNGSTGSTGGTADSGASYDSKAVAKACLPHFRGLSQKIKVIDTSAATNMKVAPGTVIAFKLTGNYSNLNINLPAGNDVPGVCFFVAGNHADVKFTTASQIDGFAYIAAGNQSSGAIEFLGGSPVRSHIELKGNQAGLNVVGLNADLCQGANLNGNAPRFQCNP